MSKKPKGDAADDDEGLSYLAQAALRRGERPSRKVPFPGLEGTFVRLVCPNEAEATEADVESRKYLTKTMGLTALELTLAQETDLARRERELELLALVLRHPDSVDEAAVEDADDLRKLIGDEERRALMAALEDFKRERFEARTPAESAEIVRLVRGLKADGALSMYWMSCGGDTQLRIVEALLEAPASSTPPSSSAA